jgi:alkylation response protein AidB-like acyl-CoA dehydrogenase
MNFGLGEEIDALRETVSRFAADRIAPVAEETDRDNQFPMHLWTGDGGAWPARHDGGSGFRRHRVGYLAHTVAMEEISRASASIGLSYGAHSNLCVNQINRWGNEAQKQKYLPKLCSGEHVGALAMSEPGSGSDVVSMKLRAEKRNDRYVLNGNKMWITNGPDANTLVVYAKTDPGAGSRGITAFLIEKRHGRVLDRAEARQAGHARLQHLRAGVRGLRSAVRERAGRGRAGRQILMSGLDYERVVLSGGPLGIMAAAMDVVVPYAMSASSSASHRQVPADAGQAGRHVHHDERLPGLCLRGGGGLRPGRNHAQGCGGLHSLFSREGDARWRWKRSRRWVATATSTTTRPAGCCAMPSSTRSGRAPAKVRRMLIGREMMAETA